MSDEKITFNLTTTKSLFRQTFIEDAQFDSPEKRAQSEATLRTLTEEIATLKTKLADVEQTAITQLQENADLKSQIKTLERHHRLHNEKTQSTQLETTENKLLKLKLTKSTTETTNLKKNFEKEQHIFESLLRDNTELKTLQNELKQIQKILTTRTHNLEKTRQNLEQSQAENIVLDKEKAALEQELVQIREKLRIQDLKDNYDGLEHVEGKLLKIKLENCENQRQRLLVDMERERKIFNKQSKPRLAKVEDNFKVLRSWMEREAASRRPDGVKELKAHIEELEKTKRDLIEGFELERTVFNRVLKQHGKKELEI